MPASGRPAPPAPKRLSNTSVALRTTRPSASPSLPSCVVFRRRSCLEASADGLVVPVQAALFDQGLERYGPRRGPSSGPRLRLRAAAAPPGEAAPRPGRGGDLEAAARAPVQEAGIS